MAKQDICNGCVTLYDFTSKCDEVFPCVLLRHPELSIRPSIVIHEQTVSQ